MADRVRFTVSVTPLETLTDENGGTRDIVASEVRRSLGGSGDSVPVTDYSGTADNQGYKDTIVNYRQASVNEGGTLVTSVGGDFLFIKNTGYKYSTATALGAVTTDCVMVALYIGPNSETRQGWATADLAGGLAHHIEIAWLKPGQGIVLPLGARLLAVSQFGAETGDLSRIGDDTEYGNILVYVRTFLANGGTATTSNAVEYLAVT